MNKHLKFSKKTSAFQECITRSMSIKAAELKAYNLAQGFPTEDPPDVMMQIAINSIQSHRNTYADMRGDPNLREAVASYTNDQTGLDYDADRNVTITCGTTEAMVATLLALMNTGDELIIFEPWYENYLPQAILSGADIKLCALKPPGYKIDLEKLRSIFSKRTKAVILNTPNNPTGRVFTLEELSGIAELCLLHNCFVIVDEIYQHITFGSHKHIPIASLEGMSDHTVIIHGISKIYAATGWRVGWAIAPYDLTIAIRRVHDFLTGTVPTPFQDAAIAALKIKEAYYQQLREVYYRRKLLLERYLDRAGFKYFPPEGTYYVLADISGLGFTSSEAFADTLLRGAGIALVPGTAFYRTPKYRNRTVRFTFSKDENTIIQAGERLVSWSKARR